MGKVTVNHGWVAGGGVSGGGNMTDYFGDYTFLCYSNFNFLVLKYIEGLVQDCSNSIANALALLQSRTKPSISCMARVNIFATD